tara:strand:- start:5154 stop:5648 length:495 start_codon:yes stop_codon:yes gene_type:complete
MQIKYPKSFWKIAEQIGIARNVMNKENNKINTRFDRGVKNSHVDTLGILGELIAIDYLTNKNINFNMCNLLDFKSSKNPDFVLNNKRIDVKTNKHSKYSHLLVNEEAHKKGLNKIDMYWFIYILDKENAEFYFVNYQNVNNWDCKLMKYTNAYYIKRENLKING